jgi:hypothetical protein
MKRSEAIKFHQEEAAALRRTAAEAPGTPGARQCRSHARDHENLADAARAYDYPEDLED